MFGLWNPPARAVAIRRPRCVGAEVHSNVASLPISLRYFHSHSSQHPAQPSPHNSAGWSPPVWASISSLVTACCDLIFRRYVVSCCTGV